MTGSIEKKKNGDTIEKKREEILTTMIKVYTEVHLEKLSLSRF
jgi:hypothetical protein